MTPSYKIFFVCCVGKEKRRENICTIIIKELYLSSYDFPSTLILVSVILLPQVTNNSIPEKITKCREGYKWLHIKTRLFLWRVFENLLKI